MSGSPAPVWFITGCSTGFGRELARLVLERGWRAVVTARSRSRSWTWSRPTRTARWPLRST